MLRFAANLTMMYHEHDFLARFGAAARDGFRGVEFLFPYDFAAADIRAQLDAHGLAQALFNAPPGNWAIGERGLASLPGRTEEFKRSIELALQYGKVLGNQSLHVMAGLSRTDVEPARQRALYMENLAYAAQQAALEGVTILIEPINTRTMPGYLLNRQDDAQAICAQIGAANLKVQFDCYHCQIVEGDLAIKLERDMAGIGHIQIAGVPHRHEPDDGELHYPYLMQLIDRLNYQGWIGCEYMPAAATSAGLGWLRGLAQQGLTELAPH